MPANNTVWKTQNVWNDIKQTLSKRDSSLIVFDLETTGLSRANDRIIEIAAIRYEIDHDMNLTEQYTFHQYINPERPLPKKIRNHSLSDFRRNIMKQNPQMITGSWGDITLVCGNTHEQPVEMVL